MTRHPVKAEQLSLGVQISEDATLDAFHVGPNTQVYSAIRPFLLSEQDKLLCLWGQKSSGVSHLLQAITHLGIHSQKQCIYLPLKSVINHRESILQGLEHLDLLCFDDLHLLVGRPSWQEAFFNLFNRVRDAGNKMALGLNTNPLKVAIELPDLQSRINWGLSFQVKPLDDNQLQAALKEKAYRHGLQITDDLARIVVDRCPRDIGSLFSVFETLDQASLMEQRKITIPFVKKVMGW